MPATEFELDACSPIAHLQCIKRTAEETLDDGHHRLWTRHWFRTSYIGRACIQRYGPILGYSLEALFAIPHYSLIAIGNGLAAGYSLLVPANPTSTTEPMKLPSNAAED